MTFLYRNRLALVLPLALLVAVGCAKKTETEKQLEYAANLRKAVDDFETSRTKTAATLTDATEETQETLSVEKPQLAGLAREWELRWEKVKGDVNALDKNLGEVGKRSLAYFDQLNKLSGSISNPELRRSEIQKNKALEVRWTKVFQSATTEVNKLKGVVVIGDDFHKLLIGAELRRSLEKDMRYIEDISTQATKILKELSALTEEGRKLAVKP